MPHSRGGRKNKSNGSARTQKSAIIEMKQPLEIEELVEPENESQNSDPNVEKNNSEPITESVKAKHPLERAWCLWYKDNDSTKSWEENQHKIMSFQTVEDFWSIFYHIKPPSELKIGTDYSLFKEGIQPMWEDPVNKKGGCWSIAATKSSNKLEVDQMWLEVLLCLIGEIFEDSEEVCGALVTSRKHNKISIWTGNAENEAAVMNIGRQLQNTLNLERLRLTYHLHSDNMSRHGPIAKIKYFL